MTVQASAASFRHAVALASKAVERRNTLPILSTVRCRANGALEISGTDLDIFVTAKVPREPGKDAEFALMSAGSVASAVGAAGGRIIELDYDDGRVALSSGALAMKVGTLPAEDFPVIRPVSEAFSATLSQGHIAAIGRIAAAMSREETRYYLNGINIKPIGETTLRCAATDGHRLCFTDIEVPDATGTLPDIIMPRKAVRLLLEMAARAGDGVKLIVGPTALVNSVEGTAPERGGQPWLAVAFKSGAADVSMQTKLIDGTFPDYSRVVPTQSGVQMLFNVGELRRALGAVSGHSDKVRAVKLTLTKDGAEASAAFIDAGIVATVKISCKHKREGYEVGFNGGYLAAMLDAAGGDEILFDQMDAASPALIRNPTDTAWTGVLMPMRV